MPSTETTKVFADRLSDLIVTAKKKDGKDIRTLEKEIGISRAALSKYQNDEAEPGINAIKKIADYFSVSVDWLLGISNNRILENQDIGKRFGLSDEAIRVLAEINRIGYATKTQLNKAGESSVCEKSPISLIGLLNDFLSSDEFLTSLCILRGIKSDISAQKAYQGIPKTQIELAKQEASKILGENIELLYGYKKIQFDFQRGAQLVEAIIEDITGYSDYERAYQQKQMEIAMESGGM